MVNIIIFLIIGSIVLIDVYMLVSARRIHITPTAYKKLNRSDLELIERNINMMDWLEFERFMTFLFSKAGYKAERTPPEADGGVDIILDKSIYVECKRWQEHNLVGRPEIQKLIGKCVEDGIKKAIFITTSFYSREALECASKIKDIELQLWDTAEIMEMVKFINSSIVLEFLGYAKEEYMQEIKR